MATYDRDTLEKMLHDPTAPPICFPIQFLKDITCNFSTEKELGRGGYGIVYKGVFRSGKIIAVKKIFGIRLVDDDLFRREVMYFMGIEHKNIVKLVGYCAESTWEAIKLPNGRHVMAEVPTRLLCFEYLCNESLKKYISDESSGLDWYKRFEIIKGICSGLYSLHEKRIVHRDLKPGNIIMDATMMPKIVDFGLSKLLGIEKSATIISGNRQGSLGYMAPEYIYQGQISTKADIFSFGVIIIEIITGSKTIDDGTFVQPSSSSHQSIEIARQQYIENVLGRWRNIFKEQKYRSPELYIQQVKECITIALRCVDYDKLRRPNACEILQKLSAVESTKHTKDLVVYQVQDEVPLALRLLPDFVGPAPLPAAAMVAPAPLHRNVPPSFHFYPSYKELLMRNLARAQEQCVRYVDYLEIGRIDPQEQCATPWWMPSNDNRTLRNRVLEDTTRSFLREQQLGRGGYEVVYRGVVQMSRLQGPARPLKGYNHGNHGPREQPVGCGGFEKVYNSWLRFVDRPLKDHNHGDLHAVSIYLLCLAAARATSCAEFNGAEHRFRLDDQKKKHARHLIVDGNEHCSSLQEDAAVNAADSFPQLP